MADEVLSDPRRRAVLRRISDTDGDPGDLLAWGEEQGISWARMKDDWLTLYGAGYLHSLNEERPGWELTAKGRKAVRPHLPAPPIPPDEPDKALLPPDSRDPRRLSRYAGHRAPAHA